MGNQALTTNYTIAYLVYIVMLITQIRNEHIQCFGEKVKCVERESKMVGWGGIN